jgi:chromosome segregation ATPase
MPATRAQLAEARSRLEALRAQLAGLPLRALRNIDWLERQASELAELRGERTAELAALPEPSRRLGRTRDPHAAERAFLKSALRALEDQEQTTLTARARRCQALGDPEQTRSEADGLRAAIRQLEAEHTQLRDELAERELEHQPSWARDALGERPSDPHQRETWEQGLRAIARHRIEYNITEPDSPLGPEPPAGDQRRAWERTHDDLDRAQRRLGREDATRGHDLDLGLG